MIWINDQAAIGQDSIHSIARTIGSFQDGGHFSTNKAEKLAVSNPKHLAADQKFDQFISTTCQKITGNPG